MTTVDQTVAFQGEPAKRIMNLYKIVLPEVCTMWGYRIVNSEEEAQDVLQEAFYQAAFRNLKSLSRATLRLAPWLKKIVVNKSHQPGKEAERLEKTTGR